MDDRWDASADSFVIQAKEDDDPEGRRDRRDRLEADHGRAESGRGRPHVPGLRRAEDGGGPGPVRCRRTWRLYRKNQWIYDPVRLDAGHQRDRPAAGRIYGVTESVSPGFGGTQGNYGIAIILLTMTVRLIMFPLGRKQAMMAKKMQDLQPVLAEVKEKYKDDKEALTRETMAVWKQNKVNPAAGCFPALIQMPIFVGLWQSLNNSVELRHSSFLYIRDLAAPTCCFGFRSSCRSSASTSTSCRSWSCR